MAKSIDITVKADSCAFFKPHWMGWKILGIIINPSAAHRIGYIFYSIILNILVTICYPLHLALYIFRSDTQDDNFKNLTVAVTCVATSIKFIIYASKLRVIRQFELILPQLDARITDVLDLEYFMKIKRRIRNIALLFFSVYVPVGITAELSFFFREDRSLLYPAWLPFNWLESTWKFYGANLYQIVGISFLILQNLVDDCFPPMSLCVLSGHIELLSMRVARIGYDDAKSMEDNEKELIRCIVDQNNLYRLFATIQNIISLSILVQFSSTAASMCVGMVALLFYVTAPVDIIYYCLYVFAIQLQIFPTCYYGSDFQYQFDQLHLAVYSSNWTNQSRTYKKNMLLFTERSLKTNMALAGGILRIHLDTFFATCRLAYSMFAIIVQMK